MIKGAVDGIASSNHTHSPLDITPQGKSSGLDADKVDGYDVDDALDTGVLWTADKIKDELSNKMNISTYDTDNDGVVEKADFASTSGNADTLDGMHASDLLDKNTYDTNNDGKIDFDALSNDGLIKINSDYTLTENDFCVLVDASTSEITITLPKSALIGKQFVIKKIDNSSNAVNIVIDSNTYIDGSLSCTLNNQYDFIRVIYDGNNYYKI